MDYLCRTWNVYKTYSGKLIEPLRQRFFDKECLCDVWRSTCQLVFVFGIPITAKVNLIDVWKIIAMMRLLYLNIWVGVGYHEGIGHCWRAPGFTGRISSWTSQQTGSYSKFSQFSFFSFKGDANLHDVFDSNDGYQIMTAFKYLNLLTFFEKVWWRHWCWSFSTETGMRKQNIWKVPDGCHVDHFMTLR